MAIDIVVKRINAVPHKHEDITEPFIGNSIDAAISRGMAVLDEEGTGSQVMTYQTEFRAGLRCGQLVEVNDSLIGEKFRGKIVGIQHAGARSDNSGAVEVITLLKIKRPTPFTTRGSNEPAS